MISQKIRKSKTDPEPLPGEAAGLEGRAEARNLVGIYAAVSGERVDQVLARFGGQGFGAFKPALAELLVEKLGHVPPRFNELRQDSAALGQVPAEGAGRATALAAPPLAAPSEAHRVMR